MEDVGKFPNYSAECRKRGIGKIAVENELVKGENLKHEENNRE